MARTIRVDDPYRGDLVAEVPLASREEADALVTRAARAQERWGKAPLAERIALCNGWVTKFEARKEEIARDVSRQMGKPLGQARNEVNGCLARARHMISIAEASLAPEV